MANETTLQAGVPTVVKIGGATLGHPALFADAVQAIEAAGRYRRVLVVTGGGVFADAVRDVDRRFGLSDAAAHWMAVLAMDQSAHLVADRFVRGVVVTSTKQLPAAFDGGQIPVLAPSTWLQQEDPLPHSWDVTSDSVAAWVAGRVGATRLVLIKPPGVVLARAPRESAGRRTGDVTDSHFLRALPADVEWTVVPADDVSGLSAVLAGAPIQTSSRDY